MKLKVVESGMGPLTTSRWTGTAELHTCCANTAPGLGQSVTLLLPCCIYKFTINPKNVNVNVNVREIKITHSTHWPAVIFLGRGEKSLGTAVSAPPDRARVRAS
eukprot:COSAG02_NODE_1164_length_14157_cov_2.925096_1_plen_104_part_00